MKVICPLMSLHGDGIGITHCQEEGCALWDQIRLECAFLSISEELADMRAEAKQKRMAESMEEEN